VAGTCPSHAVEDTNLHKHPVTCQNMSVGFSTKVLFPQNLLSRKLQRYKCMFHYVYIWHLCFWHWHVLWLLLTKSRYFSMMYTKRALPSNYW